MKHPILAFLKKVLIAVISAIAFWTLILMIFEERFIFLPSAYPKGPYEDLRFVPNAKEVVFPAEDGVRLHGVLAPAESSIATVVFSHGNAGNLSHRIDFARRMQRAGVSMFLYDYRGYGKSEGSPSEEGVYRDGRAAFDYVCDSLGVPSTQIVLWGRSLGGAVAVDVATQRTAAALILESTFSSGPDVASTAYPFLPFLGKLMHTQFDSDAKMARVTVPSLFIHGPEDDIVPISLGRKLYEAAREPKEFYAVEGAGHNDCYTIGGENYSQRIARFLASAVSAAETTSNSP